MLFLLLFIISVVLVASWFAYSVAFYSPKRKHATADDLLTGPQYDPVSDHIFRISHIMQKYPFEEICIQGQDGTTLYGRYYHNVDHAPIEILFHGYRSHAFRDCSGGHALSRKLGINTLVIDQRAQGSSGGKTITFGVLERRDCLSWVQYVTDRFGRDVPIILSGLSMGAATVLMAAGLDLPEQVTCIIADSPYSEPRAIIEKVARDRNYPVALCRPFLHLGAFLFGKFRLNSCSAKDAVRQCEVPVLLIHGEEDRLVPCSMSLEIATSCASRVQVITFPNAGHGLCYITDPIRYEAAISSFLKSIPSIKDSIRDVLTENNGKDS